MKSTTKIILCPDCGGTGTYKQEIRISAYDTTINYKECPACMGCGRLIEIVDYEPLYPRIADGTVNKKL